MTTALLSARESAVGPVTKPTVSVIVPAYRSAAFIGRAIDSVLEQSFKDFEIVVINDGSPDTAELEQVLAPYAERIRYLTRENGGPGAARNTGIRSARGEWIAFLDADDWWEPTFLAEQIGFLQSNPELDLAYCDGSCFGDGAPSATFMELEPQHGEPTLDKLLARKCSIGTSTVVVRRRRVLEVDLFDEDRLGSEDFDLWLKLARAGVRMAYQRKVLLHYRIHGTSYGTDPVIAGDRVVRILNRYAADDGLPPEAREALQATLARTHAYLALERGKRALARGDTAAATPLLRAARREFGSWKLYLTLAGLALFPGAVSRLCASRRPELVR